MGAVGRSALLEEDQTDDVRGLYEKARLRLVSGPPRAGGHCEAIRSGEPGRLDLLLRSEVRCLGWAVEQRPGGALHDYRVREFLSQHGVGGEQGSGRKGGVLEHSALVERGLVLCEEMRISLFTQTTLYLGSTIYNYV